jgi:trimeric autotransporter adhesin
MRTPKLLWCVVFLLALAFVSPRFSFAQYQISTVAGGGPINLPELKSSIGYPGNVVLDSAGNVYVADSYSSQILEITTSGTLTVVAGNGTLGYSGDNGVATQAQLNRPESVAIDSSGNIFIADTDNGVIREVVASSGLIQTVAGSASLGAGYSGDGGPATQAQLNDPYGLFVDASGNIFIADTDNCAIREVTGGTISTIAGTPGASSPCAYAGDGGAATAAQLDEPQGVFVDSAGNIFIADTDNTVIRAVNPGTQPVTIATVVIGAGNIQTVAGANYDTSDGSACQTTGDGGVATSADLCDPEGVFVDSSENIFIADTSNFAIREVVPAGTISTVAGTLGTAGYTGDGSAATTATLNYPAAVSVDGSGDIFIADTDNYVVREVIAGTINTVIGNKFLAYSGDGGSPASAQLNIPGGIFVDANEDLFIADTSNSVVREIPATNSNLLTVAGNGTACNPASYASCGDGGLATSANLNFSGGVYVDPTNNIFIADTQDSVIREVGGTSGDILTVAGNATAGYTGDGGPATAAELSGPNAVVLDGSGNIYIADTGNSVVRVVNTGTADITIAGVTIQPGYIATVAGNGTACTEPSAGCGDTGAATSAELNFSSAISLDASGDIYIADTFNNAIREVNVTTGIIQTVAGTLGQRGYSGDNGPPTSAQLNTPSGVFVDSLGNVFIADTDNAAIREVVAVTDIIQTVAGNGTAGFSGDGGAAANAELSSPHGVIEDASGNVFIADTENSRIRELVSTVEMNIEPPSADVIVSGLQQFAANVKDAKNPNVTWQVNGVTGGNSKIGTISSSGLYQAPASVPGAAVTVRAISNANGVTHATATTTLVKIGAPNVGVSTTPSGVTEVYTVTPQTFKAAVSGESNTSVNWQVNGIAGGNATYGTISGAGIYAGPAETPVASLILITATSQASPSLSGSYPVTIVTVPSATAPAAQTISAGASATYSISLNANTGNPSQPITLSCLQSTLPTGATCTFSPKTITPAATGVPFTVTVSVPSGSSMLRAPAFAPQLYFAFMPLAGILLMAGKPRRHPSRSVLIALFIALLLALSACGGGSGGNGGSGGGGTNPTNPEAGKYSIQVQGTTAAQPNAVTITTASLTVQ